MDYFNAIKKGSLRLMEVIDTVLASTLEQYDLTEVKGTLLMVDHIDDDDDCVYVTGYSFDTGDTDTIEVAWDTMVPLMGA